MHYCEGVQFMLLHFNNAFFVLLIIYLKYKSLNIYDIYLDMVYTC